MSPAARSRVGIPLPALCVVVLTVLVASGGYLSSRPRPAAAKDVALPVSADLGAPGSKVRRVAIDAGHGGNDAGTIGPTGLTEKEFVLDIAQRLKVLVESQLAAEVVMTRDEDVLLPLEQRTAIANNNKADLFISIHANSSRHETASGVETFTSHDRLDESRRLAMHVQNALANRKDAGENRGVKEAAFIVLIGANMPSILAEIGFISNPLQEQLMKTPQYREEMAGALFEGVRSFFENR
jgi:N-acetylmuramoyl-L-alanine amidase